MQNDSVAFANEHIVLLQVMMWVHRKQVGSHDGSGSSQRRVMAVVAAMVHHARKQPLGEPLSVDGKRRLSSSWTQGLIVLSIW